MIPRPVGVALLLSAILAGLALAQAPAKPATELDSLRWITGSWVQDGAKTRVEEHWTDAGGNMMLGIGRTLAGGKTVFFEFLRIEARADGIYYVAQPKGRLGTDFKLTSFDGTTATFENPQHDFPKRIRYRRNADGSLTARLDGGEGVEKGVQEFHFLPMKK
jgi:hypothetical protein